MKNYDIFSIREDDYTKFYVIPLYFPWTKPTEEDLKRHEDAAIVEKSMALLVGNVTGGYSECWFDALDENGKKYHTNMSYSIGLDEIPSFVKRRIVKNKYQAFLFNDESYTRTRIIESNHNTQWMQAYIGFKLAEQRLKELIIKRYEKCINSLISNGWLINEFKDKGELGIIQTMMSL